MKKISALVLLLASGSAIAAGWTSATINYVGTDNGAGCISLNNGEVAKIDLSTDVGRVDYSMALTALTTGKTLKIYQTDGALLSGCNQGSSSIKPYSKIRIFP